MKGKGLVCSNTPTEAFLSSISKCQDLHLSYQPHQAQELRNPHLEEFEQLCY